MQPPESTRGGSALSNASENEYRGRIIRARTEALAYPGGRRVPRDVVRHPGASAVLAEDGAGRVCLLRQYRPVAGGWLWEIPAGLWDHPGEDPAETARRELAEEAGMRATTLRSLGEIWTSPGILDERIALYHATDLTPCGTNHGENEMIEVHWIEKERALAMARTGEIGDAKSLAAFLRGWGEATP